MNLPLKRSLLPTPNTKFLKQCCTAVRLAKRIRRRKTSSAFNFSEKNPKCRMNQEQIDFAKMRRICAENFHVMSDTPLIVQRLQPSQYRLFCRRQKRVIGSQFFHKQRTPCMLPPPLSSSREKTLTENITLSKFLAQSKTRQVLSMKRLNIALFPLYKKYWEYRNLMELY